MTDEQFYAWLRKGQGRHVTLVEVDTDVPRRLSTVPYTTLATDARPNLRYQAVVEEGFAFSESLSLNGAPSVSVGDVALANADGLLDGWLSEVWTNRQLRVYVGDASWSRDEFKLVFSGVVFELTAGSTSTLNIVLRSSLDRLNTPVTDETLEGDTPNKDRVVPVTLGECHNITPLLTAPELHEYQVHESVVERIIEVRDGGIPVPFSETGNGKFRLTGTPQGIITASVQGALPYVNTVAGLVRHLATEYGSPDQRFSVEELDIAQLAAFESAHPQPVGYFISGRANTLDVAQQVASSVGAQVVPSREGKLRIIKVSLPGAGPSTAIGPDDYLLNSLQMVDRPEVVAGVKLGWCRNWTVQENLDALIPPEHKSLFAQEWLTVAANDPAVATAYRLFAEIPQQDTYLLRESDAQAEAVRRLDLWSVQRTVYQVECYAHMLKLELGAAVRLKADRWGLQAGKAGVVISLEPDWVKGRVTVGVLT